MKTYRFYDTNGLILPGIFSTNDVSMLATNTPPGHKVIEGQFDHLSQKVDPETGTILDYQPPTPSENHEWNAETKRWQLTAAAADRANRHAAAIARIAVLEGSQHRALREHALGIAAAAARLKAIDDEIASLRSQIVQ